jgi:hypothetical protein
MARWFSFWTAFNSGELSPKLEGRIDIAGYQQGGRRVRNFVPMVQGGAQRRPGTYYVAEVKDSSKTTRLIPFIFSTTQAYIIEAGHNYFRFYKDHGQIQSAGSAYEVSSSFASTDVMEVDYAQSADTMWFTHHSYKPSKLTRTAHTSWQSTSYTPTSDPFSGSGNFPRCVAMYEERLFFGGTDNNPQRIYGSKSGDFESQSTGSASADDAVVYTIASDDVQVIKHMVPTLNLNVLTVSGEFILNGGNLGDAVTPTNVKVTRSSTYGSSIVKPKAIGDAVLFWQKSNRRLRELIYSVQSDSLVGNDLTLLADHVPEGGVVDMAWCEEPYRTLWCPRADGRLCGLTYDRQQKVVAWHLHEMGGSFSSGSVAYGYGVVESVASIPAPAGDGDELWMVVKRTINGGTKRYIEYLKPFDFGTDIDDAYFVDCGLSYDSAASSSTLTGYSHISGQSVSILGDGAVQPNVTVGSGGTVSLSIASLVAHVGLPYTSTLQTQRPEGGAQDGISQGRPKRIHSAFVRLYNSIGMQIGPDEDNLDEVPFRTSADLMDSSVAMFNGDKEVVFPGDWETAGRITIVQEQPLPTTVIGIGYGSVVSEK